MITKIMLCHYGKCRVLHIVLLSVIMLTVVAPIRQSVKYITKMYYSNEHYVASCVEILAAQ